MAVEFVECDDEVEDCYEFYNGTGDEKYLSSYPEVDLITGLIILVVGVFIVVAISKVVGF